MISDRGSTNFSSTCVEMRTELSARHDVGTNLRLTRYTTSAYPALYILPTNTHYATEL